MGCVDDDDQLVDGLLEEEEVGDDEQVLGLRDSLPHLSSCQPELTNSSLSPVLQ